MDDATAPLYSAAPFIPPPYPTVLQDEPSDKSPIPQYLEQSGLPMPQPSMPQPSMPQPSMPQPSMPQPPIQPNALYISEPSSSSIQISLTNPHHQGNVSPSPPTGMAVMSPRNISQSPHETRDREIKPDSDFGLDPLFNLERIVVQQKVEKLEAFIGFEMNNKYIVKNNVNQTLFTLKEDTSCCLRLLCRRCRSFTIRMTDVTGRVVMTFHRKFRPFRCCCFSCFPCCMQAVTVRDANGKLVGRIRERFKCVGSKYRVYGDSDVPILNIVTNTCFLERDFGVFALEGTKVGSIEKQWGGVAREVFTDADNFTVAFPRDMKATLKALTIAATILIDFIHFEDNNIGGP